MNHQNLLFAHNGRWQINDNFITYPNKINLARHLPTTFSCQHYQSCTFSLWLYSYIDLHRKTNNNIIIISRIWLSLKLYESLTHPYFLGETIFKDSYSTIVFFVILHHLFLSLMCTVIEKKHVTTNKNIVGEISNITEYQLIHTPDIQNYDWLHRKMIKIPNKIGSNKTK